MSDSTNLPTYTLVEQDKLPTYDEYIETTQTDQTVQTDRDKIIFVSNCIVFIVFIIYFSYFVT
jgi:hypothetical protein